MTGDDDWTDWLARHGAALVLFARQWVPSHADAEDVVQEAFVRFWRTRPDADDPTAYLFACVRSQALDWRRGQSRRTRREAAAARPERTEPLFAPKLEQDERRAALEAAVAVLPAEQREVLVLKIWGGLTFPQIAQALGLSPNTAASRYRYALTKLRGQLTEAPTP
jgi:RNA polymerase sigma-70 factor, ECF subfamily